MERKVFQESFEVNLREIIDQIDSDPWKDPDALVKYLERQLNDQPDLVDDILDIFARCYVKDKSREKAHEDEAYSTVINDVLKKILESMKSREKKDDSVFTKEVTQHLTALVSTDNVDELVEYLAEKLIVRPHLATAVLNGFGHSCAPHLYPEDATEDPFFAKVIEQVLRKIILKTKGKSSLHTLEDTTNNEGGEVIPKKQKGTRTEILRMVFNTKSTKKN